MKIKIKHRVNNLTNDKTDNEISIESRSSAKTEYVLNGEKKTCISNKNGRRFFYYYCMNLTIRIIDKNEQYTNKISRKHTHD